MGDLAFRQLVRDEVVGWLTQQKGALDLIVSRIADALVPPLAIEVRKSLLVRLGQLEPDERAATLTILRNVRRLLAIVRTTDDDEEDVKRMRTEVATLMEVLDRFKKPGSTVADFSDQGGQQ